MSFLTEVAIKFCVSALLMLVIKLGAALVGATIGWFAAFVIAVIIVFVGAVLFFDSDGSWDW